MLGYAAHDSHFLLHIASSIVAEALQMKPDDGWVAEALKEMNGKAKSVTYKSRQQVRDASKYFSFPAFKKLIDFYD